MLQQTTQRQPLQQNSNSPVVRRPRFQDNRLVRDDQQELARLGIQARRAVVLAPTGSGKTWVILEYLKQLGFPPALVLSHTVSITKQTYKEFRMWRETRNTQCVTGGITVDREKKYHVSTMQSAVQQLDKLQGVKVVVIDEAHHTGIPLGTYETIINTLQPEYIFAVTATRRDTPMVGPVVGSLAINEAADRGIIAKLNVCIKRLPYSYVTAQQPLFSFVYEEGVMLNLDRNQMIVDAVAEHKGSALVLVNAILHGETLNTMFKEYGLKTEFIRGWVPAREREKAREKLNRGELDVVVATTCWREGINIPNLTLVVNGGGGKSEIATLQCVGRGLRRTARKKTAKILDFYDPSHVRLIKHFQERARVYLEHGWVTEQYINDLTEGDW